jgi:hypothetical protein
MLIRVKDLVKKLQELDQDIYVFTEGYESGFDNPDVEYEINQFALNVNEESYCGCHEKIYFDTDLEYYKNGNYDIVTGIVL